MERRSAAAGRAIEIRDWFGRFNMSVLRIVS
jgi:hypothetical protein